MVQMSAVCKCQGVRVCEHLQVVNNGMGPALSRRVQIRASVPAGSRREGWPCSPRDTQVSIVTRQLV